MLIDWVTGRIPLACFGEADRISLRELGERIQRFDPKTGEQVWETSAWDSIRSDSHHLSYRVTSDALWMQGSPARVIGDGDAVFGAGAASALDLPGCVARMRDVLAMAVGVAMPQDIALWKVSRVDVTGNLFIGSLEQVRVALRVLRDVEGGRYRVSQQAGDTVYWSSRSRLRAGKAYAKGPHLVHLMRQKTYDGRQYSGEDIRLAQGLLRLELRLGAQWWRERGGGDWWEVTADQLNGQWQAYFERMLGDCEVTEMNIEARVKAVAKTEGQAKAALSLWALIQAYGWEQVRNITSRPTWYRNLKILRAAGLSDADFSAAKVVAFRRRVLDAREVASWEELKRLAA
jgi:II/X family phage/plasmid replication protein